MEEISSDHRGTTMKTRQDVKSGTLLDCCPVFISIQRSEIRQNDLDDVVIDPSVLIYPNPLAVGTR